MIPLFIFLSLLVLYTYIFYPFLLWIMASVRGKKPRIQQQERDIFFPTVSMVIPAYNEEDVIEEKLENCLGLDYPHGSIEFVVGSDNSTDRTNEIVERYSRSDPRIKLSKFNRREGKAAVLNKVMPGLESDIVVFSDSDTFYEEIAVKYLVRNFSDPKVGGVCGKLVLMKGDDGSCNEEGLYWNYENRIKELEASLRTIIGINGQAFAIRKNLFEELPADSITEDQVLGMGIISKGYDILFEPEAICREKAHSLREEFKRRIRISAGNFQSIPLSAKVLDPRMGFASFALWSHKILRWLAPFFLIAIFVSNIFLSDIIFFRLTLLAQVLFYLLSFLHYGLNVMGYDSKILRMIFYFNLMNLAVLIGFFRYLTGTQKVTWEKAG